MRPNGFFYKIALKVISEWRKYIWFTFHSNGDRMNLETLLMFQARLSIVCQPIRIPPTFPVGKSYE